MEGKSEATAEKPVIWSNPSRDWKTSRAPDSGPLRQPVFGTNSQFTRYPETSKVLVSIAVFIFLFLLHVFSEGSAETSCLDRYLNQWPISPDSFSCMSHHLTELH